MSPDQAAARITFQRRCRNRDFVKGRANIAVFVTVLSIVGSLPSAFANVGPRSCPCAFDGQNDRHDRKKCRDAAEERFQAELDKGPAEGAVAIYCSVYPDSCGWNLCPGAETAPSPAADSRFANA
jgi:hypothetical protein